MPSTTDIVISILSGILATILMRIYDKFYNKQYTKSDYIKIGCLNTLSTLVILYLNSIISPTLPGNILSTSTTNTIQQGGSSHMNKNISGNSGIVNKVTSALNDNLEYFNPNNSSHSMKFKTGTPNF